MSVSSVLRKQQFTLDGIEDNYTFTFRALTSAPEDIKCSVKTAGVTTILTYTTQYSVSINSDGVGGTVTLVSAGTIGLGTLTVYRETTNTQESDYDDYNQFPANTLEEDIDKRTMVDQEQSETFNRCVKLPIESAYTDIILPEPETGKALKWNNAGDNLENSEVSIEDIDSAVAATLASAISAATSATTALAAQVAAELAETNAEAAASSITSSGTLNISKITTSTIYVSTTATIANLTVSTISITNPVTLPNNSVATTQSQANNSTKIATTAYVDTGLSGKLSAPGAWTAYTPTVSSSSGALTTASASGRYCQIGKIVHFSVVVTITNNGTGSGAILVGNPVTAYAGLGFSSSVVGENSTNISITGFVAVSQTYLYKYEGSYPGDSGVQLFVSGTYEAA